MNILIIYYSKSGHTEKVAKQLSNELNADLRKIEEQTKRNGIFGYIKAGYDSLLGKRVVLVNPNFDVLKYDLIFFGTPTWAARPAPPIITFMDNLDLKGKKVINFTTMMGNCGKTLNILRDLAGKKGANVLHSFSIISKKKGDMQILDEVNAVIEDLRNRNVL